MDLASKLSMESDLALQTRRRNAHRIALASEGTARGEEAVRHLELISAEFERRSLPGAIARFLEKCPRGFNDEMHMREERDYKCAAAEYCAKHLTADAFAEVAAGAPTETLLGYTAHLIQKTNLLQGAFEKPKLLDCIRDERNTRTFLNVLGGALHGPDAAAAFKSFVGFLSDHELRKWTFATYFLFFAHPDRFLFVKPEAIKGALKVTGYPVEYQANPSWNDYQLLLDFAGWLGSRLTAQGNPDLIPRDMIDVQSFIWHLAPTGKWSREAIGR